jgi:hypothetical protein
MNTNYSFNRYRLLSHLRRLMIVFVVAVSAVALALSLATAAGATAPTTQVFDVDVTFVNTSLCGFPITIHDEGTFKVKTYVDRDGNVTRTILTNQSRYTETLTANGKSLVSNVPYAVIADFVRGTQMQVGLQVGFHVPGEGPVYFSSGRLVFDLETGELISFSGVERVELAALCDFLAN